MGARGLVGVVSLTHAAGAMAEDGYRLWLRYTPIAGAARDGYAARATGIVALGSSPGVRAAVAELNSGLTGMLGVAPGLPSVVAEGSIVLGTPAQSPQVAARAARIAACRGRSRGVRRCSRLAGRAMR